MPASFDKPAVAQLVNLKDMALAIANSLTAEPPLHYKRFTRREVEAMLDAGLFQDQRFELIDGDLIDKTGQKPPHATAIQRLLDLFTRMLGCRGCGVHTVKVASLLSGKQPQ